ncbi:hypothetical protein MSIMFI_00960 [Mycobacterium simulans]|uniref:hypothetical protein n=1 Tax=Mycobacterium simulans TaxID=627089 RepID=UPI00174D4131|nr:hypothetical protein [Mycobacterium simulans]SON59476.1 hypothetical protein MSIMFI_00960 [Mycobacterium simulans]
MVGVQTCLVSAARAARVDGECLRYRLDVAAGSAADVVRTAGGWLYDRAMAGWEVTVLLPHGCDARPLRILGAGTGDLESGMNATSHALAVSAEAFTADDRVRDRVLDALGDPLTEVALWGDGWPLGLNRGMAKAQHVLSGAARAFKSQALAAAGIPCCSISPTEMMMTDSAWLR